MSNYIRNNLTGGLAPVNKELEKIEQVLREKLDRLPEQGQANQLTSDLDVNNQRILNVPAPSNPTDLIRLKDLDGFTNGNGKLPPQDGQAGEWLRTDGTTAYWDALPDFDKGGISPEDFGAVGDGVTDDTAALQAAIDAAKGDGSLGLPVSYVRLENKTYTHTGIVIDRAVAIVGVDRNSTRLKCLSTSAPAIQVSLAHDGNNFQVGGRPGPTVLIKDVIVESDKTFASSNHGIEFINASSDAIRGWVYLDGVDIHSMGGNALSANTWEGAVKANNCKFLNNGGKQLNATSCADWQFVGCEFGVTPDDNILLSGCAAFTFTTCNIYSSTGDLVTLFTDAAATAPVNHHFVSCSFDRSSEGHGVVYNVRNNGNVTFTNCYWTYNGQGAPETYSDIWIDSSVRRGPSIVGGWMQSAVGSDSLYNIFFNGALSSCYTTGVQFEAGNARSANVTNSIAQLKFEGAENFATFADAQASTWTEEGDKVTVVERANAPYIVKDSGYTLLTGDISAANGSKLELQIDETTNIENFGTSADWDAAFDSLIDRAQSDAFPIRLGANTYTLTAQKTLDGSVPLIGQGSKVTRLFCEDLATSLIKFETVNTSNAKSGVSGVSLYFNYTGAQTSSKGIEFAGTDTTKFFQYNDFEDITFYGCESCFWGTQSPRTTSFGLEFNVAWCNFRNIKSRPSQHEVKYVFDFPNGSGTGNSFTDCKVKVDSAGSVFNYTGVNSVVGDLLIQGFSCSASAIGGSFITVGDDTAYRSNVCMLGNQIDASLQIPFNLSSVGVDEYKDWKWIGNLGGLTELNSAIGYTSGSVIIDREVSDFRVARRVVDLPTGAQSVPLCKVDLKTNNACTVNFEIYALVQGVNSGMLSAKYHIRNSGTASPTLEVKYDTPSTPIMSISSTVSGSVVSFFLDISPTSSGSVVDAQMQGIGSNFRLERI